MLYFAPWKKLLIVLACLGGLLFAAPNLFDERSRAAFPSWLPSDTVNLGLDLQGGVHLLVEADIEGVYRERMEGLAADIRSELRRAGVRRFTGLEAEADSVSVRITNAEDLPKALAAVADLAEPVFDALLGVSATEIAVTEGPDQTIVAALSEPAKRDILDRTMAQTLEIVRRRIDETGTREPTVQRQGERRVLIQVPGLGSAEELLAIIGRTAKLTFHEVLGTTGDPTRSPGPGNMLVVDKENPALYYILASRPTVSGERLVDARPGFDQSGLPSVDFRFDAAGGARFGEYTANNVGRQFAIVLDNEVISAPVIRTAILGGSGQITGNFTVESASTLAILLRSGALPADVTVVEQRTVGPDLGADSIAAGEIASIVAGVAVLIFMVLSYGLFGLLADIALIFNVAMIFALLSLIGATLTLPGIAGIVLTIGMAVDANVLIFERIREELKRARGPARAIENGYNHAFSAIIDANVTTFIAAVILFAMGSGPVKGFAVTLGFGIVTSVFTAVFVTRFLVSEWMTWRRPKTITV